MIHIVKQQEVVTYVSPVANGIKTFNWQKLSVSALSFFSECLDQELKVEFQSEQDCHRNKELAKAQITLYYGANAKHYERNVMHKMLKHHAKI